MNSISSIYLDAFAAVAGTRSFTRAAERLHITQSALSQRVSNLENELEAALFIRDRTGVQLTELGHELLRYCQTRSALEAEFLSHLHARDEGELSGEIRIGGYSSVMRSVLLPALAPLLRSNPQVRLNLITRELRDLPELFRRGEIDFMVLDHRLEREGVESVALGMERNVLVQNRKPASGGAREIYLDHDENDQTTRNYLRLGETRTEKEMQKIRRRYLGDIYALLDGVRLGLGKAVLPRHLIQEVSGLVILHPEKTLDTPVVLHYHAQPYYSRLHLKTLEVLREACPKIL